MSRKQPLHVKVGALAVCLVKIEGYAKESRVKFVMLQLLMPKLVLTEQVRCLEGCGDTPIELG